MYHTAELAISNSLIGGKNIVQIILLLGGRLKYELSGCKLFLANCLPIHIFGARRQPLSLLASSCVSKGECLVPSIQRVHDLYFGGTNRSDFMDRILVRPLEQKELDVLLLSGRVFGDVKKGTGGEVAVV